jgi:hypothetical protein
MAPQTYGIFVPEGCVDDGFWSIVEAEKALEGHGLPRDEVDIEPVCSRHPGHPYDSCEECD